MYPVSQSFRDRAPKAAFAEAWVGACLTRAGFYVVLHPWVIDGKDHSQSFDLTVLNEAPVNAYYPGCTPEPKEVEVEVKGLSLTFHNLDSYPFNDVLVCSFNNFRKKYPGKDKTGRDFFLLSMPTGAIVWVPKGTPIFIKEVLDSTRNELYKAVACNREDLRSFQDFAEAVNG